MTDHLACTLKSKTLYRFSPAWEIDATYGNYKNVWELKKI